MLCPRRRRASASKYLRGRAADSLGSSVLRPSFLFGQAGKQASDSVGIRGRGRVKGALRARGRSRAFSRRGDCARTPSTVWGAERACLQHGGPCRGLDRVRRRAMQGPSAPIGASRGGGEGLGAGAGGTPLQPRRDEMPLSRRETQGRALGGRARADPSIRASCTRGARRARRAFGGQARAAGTRGTVRAKCGRVGACRGSGLGTRCSPRDGQGPGRAEFGRVRRSQRTRRWMDGDEPVIASYSPYCLALQCEKRGERDREESLFSFCLPHRAGVRSRLLI